jgi:hypothetical protein
MPEEHRQRLKDCRILVIEDEYFLADDLKRVLRSEGAEVVGPTGERSEALRLIDRDGFDIAVIDINLHDELAYPLSGTQRAAGRCLAVSFPHDTFSERPRCFPRHWGHLVSSASSCVSRSPGRRK